MNRVFCTGDTHFDHDIAKLGMFATEKGSQLTKDDYVIICGDFGLLWNYEETGKSILSNPDDKCWADDELQLFDWYNQLPWTTLIVLGNHDNWNRWETYPVTAWHGGRVQKLSDSIIRLMEGEIYDIGGRTILAYGGAQSTDRGTIKGQDNMEWCIHKWWWPQEVPLLATVHYTLDNLENYGNKVDYVISHDCPQNTKDYLYLCEFDGYGNIRANKVSSQLQAIADAIEYKHWFCGHLHQDKTIKDVTILYEKVRPIEWTVEDEWNELKERKRFWNESI